MKTKTVVVFWTLLASLALLFAASAFHRDPAATAKKDRDSQPRRSATLSVGEQRAFAQIPDRRVVNACESNSQTLSLRVNIRLTRASERWRSSRSNENEVGSVRSNPISRATQWSPYFLARNFLTPRKPNEALFILLLTLRN